MEYNSKSHDIDEILAMVSQEVSQENIRDFHNMMASAGYSMFDSLVSTSSINLQIVRLCTVVFNSMLNAGHIRGISDNQKFRAALNLNRYDNEDLYKSLPLAAKVYFIKFYGELFFTEAKFFLTSASKLSSAPTHSLTRKDSREIMSRARCKSRSPLLISELEENCTLPDSRSKFDYSKPSAEFIDSMSGEIAQNLFARYSIIQEVLILWRTLYGEQTTLEFIKKLVEYSGRLDAKSILRMIDNWDTLRNYPLEWAVSL